MKKQFFCAAAILVGISLFAQESLSKPDSLSVVLPDTLAVAAPSSDSLQAVTAQPGDTLQALAPQPADTLVKAIQEPVDSVQSVPAAPLAPADSAAAAPAVSDAGDSAVPAPVAAVADEQTANQSKKQTASKEKNKTKEKKEKTDAQPAASQYAGADSESDPVKKAAELAAAEAERKAAQAEAIRKAERDGRRSVKGRQYKYFNHMGIGVNFGILNGIGADIAFPLGGCFQIRGGYSFIPSSISYKKAFDLGEHAVNGSPRSFDNVTLEIKPGVSTARAFLDFFPGRRTPFHFTVGAYYGVGSNSFVDIVADLRGTLDPDEYGTAYIEFEDTTDPSKTARVSTDKKGFLNVAFRPKQEIRPYVGIGWGRGANLKRRVSVSFEIGALYVKGLGIEVYDYDKNAHYITSGMTDGKDTVENPLSGRHMHIIDDLGKFPVLPMMKFGINVRLF